MRQNSYSPESAAIFDLAKTPSPQSAFQQSTELLRARDALHESEGRYRELFETAGDAIFVSDEHGKIVDVNQLACDSLGYSRQELLNMFVWALNPEKWTPETVRKVINELQPGNPQTFESHLQRRDGSRFPVEIRVGNFEVGGRRFNLDLVRDITARKRAEQALREANETLERRVAERTAELAQANAALREALTEVERLKNRLLAENIYLQEEINLEHNFAEIVTRSDLMKKELRKIEQVAATDATVLILGETGTGKELIARAVHNLSPRRERPLVKINCAALPAALIESELFGHEKGAFTGALARKAGRFELADGGTIFLDEIGDMQPELQAKLLRVLQEGEFERVGGTQTLKVKVRVIAATNRDLEKMAKAGKFREDLFYRLQVFPIVLPPLRRRQEDIPLLVTHFVKTFNQKMGKQIATIPPETMNAFQAYAWPGNVRELENVIERAVILTSGEVLAIDEHFVANQNAKSEMAAAGSMEEVERNHLLRVLTETNWRISGANSAAERLQLNASTLRSRMQKLGIKKPSP